MYMYVIVHVDCSVIQCVVQPPYVQYWDKDKVLIIYTYLLVSQLEMKAQLRAGLSMDYRVKVLAPRNDFEIVVPENVSLCMFISRMFTILVYHIWNKYSLSSCWFYILFLFVIKVTFKTILLSIFTLLLFLLLLSFLLSSGASCHGG